MKRGFISQTDPETDPEGWELEILEAAQDGLYSALEMKGDNDEMSKDALEKLDQVIGLLDELQEHWGYLM
jgi:hypothetical protein